VDYEEKGLSLRQISAKKVHSRSTISKFLKGSGMTLRAPGQGHGNPSQLKFGYRKVEGRVVPHRGELRIIEAIRDFRSEGLTMRQIAERMTALRIPSKNGKLKWHPMMVKRVIDFK
jgi:hypothetical protein